MPGLSRVLTRMCSPSLNHGRCYGFDADFAQAAQAAVVHSLVDDVDGRRGGGPLSGRGWRRSGETWASSQSELSATPSSSTSTVRVVVVGPGGECDVVKLLRAGVLVVRQGSSRGGGAPRCTPWTVNSGDGGVAAAGEGEGGAPRPLPRWAHRPRRRRRRNGDGRQCIVRGGWIGALVDRSLPDRHSHYGPWDRCHSQPQITHRIPNETSRSMYVDLVQSRRPAECSTQDFPLPGRRLRYNRCRTSVIPVNRLRAHH